jgi:four helix bundle protein
MKNSGVRSLAVYQMAFSISSDIFRISKKFPKEETYSLTDQVRRSSRSVCANLSEAYAKRAYPKHFVSKLTDVDGELSETVTWILFAVDAGYLSEEEGGKLIDRYEPVGKMVHSMINHPERFAPKVVMKPAD